MVSLFQHRSYYISLNAYTHSLLFDACITDQFRQPQLNEIAHPIVPNVEQNKIRAHRKHVCIGNITPSALPARVGDNILSAFPLLFHIYNTKTKAECIKFTWESAAVASRQGLKINLRRRRAEQVNKPLAGPTKDTEVFYRWVPIIGFERKEF